jgi:tRNA uracil 4-sulfurtransferase
MTLDEERVVLVRYGELFLKSEPVKRHFIGLLIRNLTRALDDEEIPFRYETPRGRILLYGDQPDKIAEAARRVFGVVDVSISRTTSADLDDISRTACGLAAGKVHPGTRFAIRAKRQNRSVGLNSQEMGAYIGSAILDAYPDLRVDLDTPDYQIFVETRDNTGFVYDHRLPAPGGLPFGSQGNVLVLLSSGIDSPVASWLMMKRGCGVVHLTMDPGRWGGEAAAAGAIENHRRLSLWVRGFPVRLIVLDSSHLYESMKGGNSSRYTCVICKRFMLRVAARLMASEGAAAVVTGENLGQVASQTLANLSVISSAVEIPVLRPLITYDKGEIVTLARRIGTFNPDPGDTCCRAVPRMPATGADAEAVIAAEEEMGMGEILRTVMETGRIVTSLSGRIVSDEAMDIRTPDI